MAEISSARPPKVIVSDRGAKFAAEHAGHAVNWRLDRARSITFFACRDCGAFYARDLLPSHAAAAAARANRELARVTAALADALPEEDR